MKRENIVLISGILACIVLLGAIVLTFVLKDNKAPVISVGSISMTYTEGEPYSVLLEGVKAYDDKDGDVSNTLIVDSIIIVENNTKAKITYAAKDYSNNVAKSSKVINYVRVEKQTNGETDISEDGTDKKTIGKFYTVTFNYNTGVLDGVSVWGNSTSSKKVSAGSKFGSLPNPSASGYKFDGWYTSKTDGELVSADTVFDKETSMTLYAHWTKEEVETPAPTKATVATQAPTAKTTKEAVTEAPTEATKPVEEEPETESTEAETKEEPSEVPNEEESGEAPSEEETTPLEEPVAGSEEPTSNADDNVSEPTEANN